MRRSIPFADETTGECGLLFLAYQTSIERQFEFVTRAWRNNPHLHDTDNGHDPIAGQSFGMRGDRTRARSRVKNIRRELDRSGRSFYAI
jgi:deferrochelatase/peroxidase EfeB